MTKRPLLVRMTAELAVIFAGVYGAFWVESYRQELEDRERAGKILAGLEAEIDNIAAFGPVVVDSITSVLEAYEAAREGGGRPPPAHYREPNAETPSIAVWLATLSSGGVNLLEPELFFRLASFYNLVESASERYLRYNAFTESVLLPRLPLGAEAFYDPASGRMDPMFTVHMDLLRTLRDEIAYLVSRAGPLRDEVRRERERLS